MVPSMVATWPVSAATRTGAVAAKDSGTARASRVPKTRCRIALLLRANNSVDARRSPMRLVGPGRPSHLPSVDSALCSPSPHLTVALQYQGIRYYRDDVFI